MHTCLIFKSHERDKKRLKLKYKALIIKAKR